MQAHLSRYMTGRNLAVTRTARWLKPGQALLTRSLPDSPARAPRRSDDRRMRKHACSRERTGMTASPGQICPQRPPDVPRPVRKARARGSSAPPPSGSTLPALKVKLVGPCQGFWSHKDLFELDICKHLKSLLVITRALDLLQHGRLLRCETKGKLLA